MLLFHILLLIIIICLIKINKNKEKFSDNEIIFITQFYKPKSEERYNEIKECLKNNLENKFIKEIHLFIDGNDYKDIYKLSKKNNYKINAMKIKKRLTYKDVFEYSNKNLKNKIIVLSNSDIHFDDSLSKINDYNFNKSFIALTRINDDNTYENLKSGCSQDTWIFKTPIKVIKDKDYEKDGIILGIGGCDNKIAYVMKNSGYDVINPCRKIKTYHKHKNDIRNWYNDDRKRGYQKPFLYVKCK